ncbi:MAG TPA: type II toxin-antitoxin system HicB family antitoxin [Candidatus Obscuribacterales bacterium]
MKRTKSLDEYLNMTWHFSVHPSEWEGEKGYCAWVSELPNCSSFGRTQSEALAAVAQLLPAYLKAALESKADIEAPEGREPEAEDVGGTIVLRLPKSLHLGLKHAARTESTSLNQFALFALTKMVYQTTRPAALRSTAKRKTGVGKAAAKKTASSVRQPPARKRTTAEGY